MSFVLKCFSKDGLNTDMSLCFDVSHQYHS